MPPLSRSKQSRIKAYYNKVSCAFRQFTHRFVEGIKVWDVVMNILSVIASIVLIGAMIIIVGFDHSHTDRLLLHNLIHGAQIIFLANVFYKIIFRYSRWRGSPFIVILGIGVLLTLIPLVSSPPVRPVIPILSAVIYSRWFVYLMLLAYAVSDVSRWVVDILGKRTNPSLLLSASFLVLIFLGALMLMLPKSTYAGISFDDALFVSTSAVCITGLTPVDIYANLTPLGTVVLSLLIQVGGLGVMTFTSLFALFFSGRASIYSQLLIKDMIYSKSMGSLLSTLIYILGFTLVIEGAGALIVWLSIHDTLGLSTGAEIAVAAFHSLSSFCNAGFSIMPGGMANPDLLYGNISIYWITSLLVILGAIGFPILVNFKDALFLTVRRQWQKLHHRDTEPRNVHPYDMNTKIVLLTFFLLFAAGATGFYLLEQHNILAGMTQLEKITQSVFNSVVPRSAGFSSVNPASFTNATLLMVMFLMWVGGGSQSTAGGVKVNTLAAICLNLRAIILGHERIHAFGRTIAVWSVRRANAVVALSIFSYFAFSITLLVIESGLPPRDLLFETLSALFTVGSSTGITPYLSTAGKMVLCSAMFLGRVGIISLLCGLAGNSREKAASFPTDNLIIT